MNICYTLKITIMHAHIIIIVPDLEDDDPTMSEDLTIPEPEEVTETEVWETDSDDCESTDECSSISKEETQPALNDQYSKPSNAVVRWFVLLLLSWQSAFTVSSCGMAKLLLVIKQVLTVIARITASPLTYLIASLFPGSLYMAYKHLGIHQNSFSTYAVCGRCYSIYSMKDCIDDVTGQSKRCSYLAFPQHRMSHCRVPCYGPLVKQVSYTNGKTKFVPLHTYAYKNLCESLQRILLLYLSSLNFGENVLSHKIIIVTYTMEQFGKRTKYFLKNHDIMG